MNSTVILSVILGYFALLIYISNRSSKGLKDSDFYNASKSSPWYLVAFGMIGTTLSGVTFISVPGWVGTTQFSYFEMTLGYIFGYLFIALVLMPLYYRLELITIYTYLRERFGKASYKTGSLFFILSRTFGAAFRLYLVAAVLQFAVFDAMGVSFYITVFITLVLIWVYTNQGGIKTIVFTDTLQTVFMISALIACMIGVAHALGWSMGEAFSHVRDSKYSQVFFWDSGPKNFFKQFFAGIFLVIVMTGLDQDMMQKNLTIKTLGDAQKNMYWFTVVLVVIIYVFLVFGAMLYLYVDQTSMAMPERADMLFPTVALQHMPSWIGIMFILGLTAAAYSSADSALTSLTTTFCIDILNFEPGTTVNEVFTRRSVHVGFSAVIFLIIVVFYQIQNDSVISSIFQIASDTYGPLLGLFAFGLLSDRPVLDRFVPLVCLAAPVLTYLSDRYSEELINYEFGFELLILNGLYTFIGMWLLSRKQ